MKSQEEMEDSLPLRVKRPRAVVLGPTRELTNQVSILEQRSSEFGFLLDSTSCQIIESSCSLLFDGFKRRHSVRFTFQSGWMQFSYPECERSVRIWQRIKIWW